MVKIDGAALLAMFTKAAEEGSEHARTFLEMKPHLSGPLALSWDDIRSVAHLIEGHRRKGRKCSWEIDEDNKRSEEGEAEKRQRVQQLEAGLAVTQMAAKYLTGELAAIRDAECSRTDKAPRQNGGAARLPPVGVGG